MIPNDGDEGSPLMGSEDNTEYSLMQQNVESPPSGAHRDEATTAYLAISSARAITSNTEGEEEQGEQQHLWMESLLRLQTLSLLAAHGLAILAMLLVLYWIHLLGGLSWKAGQAKLVFNWHPLFMITAFCFMTVASFSFRFRTIGTNRQVAKLLHGMAWAIAALCGGVGVLAVVKSHNDPLSGFVANLYSLHSWVGVFVIVLYTIQFMSGFVTFGGVFWSGPTTTPSFKASVLAVHYFVGPLVYLLTAATILLGLQEKEGFVGCAYKVTQADTFPLSHFGDIPFVCRVSHLLGIVVLAMTCCTLFAMHNFSRGSFRRH
jgi:cytochrome b-561